MKFITRILITIVTGYFFIGCNDWLDVSSDEIVLEKDAFNSYEGYRTALVGAYQLAASEDLWGKELTWGFMSIIAKNYRSYPNEYSNLFTTEDFENHTSVRSVASRIWETGFKTIANCNNILRNIEDTNEDFFEYSWERNMIIAEAKALRALIHFELLRLFVSAPITGYSGIAIPYSKIYPDLNPSNYTMDEIFEALFEDLDEASEKLKAVDIDVLLAKSSLTTISRFLFYGLSNLRDDGSIGKGTGFFSYRGYKMNYWGVMALKARVYSYFRYNDKAVEIIDELMKSWVGEGNFYWGHYQNNSNKNEISGKRIPETLIGFWNMNLYTKYENESATITNDFQRVYRVLLDNLFGTEIVEDNRYVGLYNTIYQTYRVWERPSDVSYESTLVTDTIMSFHGVMTPVLELPELYYIKCEYLAQQGRMDEACQLLRQLKNGRNIATMVNTDNYDAFIEMLKNDITREYLTRGQTWHYFKKMNWRDMYNGVGGYWQVPDNWYVLPIPDSEINFY